MLFQKQNSFKSQPLNLKDWEDLNQSQFKVAGFNLETYQQSKVLLVGAGGIGSHVGLGIVRKGIGHLDVMDDDEVEAKNLTRQLFYPKDIGKNKAIQLARHLSKQGFFKTEVKGYPKRFQEFIEDGKLNYDVIICGVDNNPTRVAVSKIGIKESIPVIHAAVSRDGSQLYCAIQEPERACFGCMFPHAVNDDTYPCNLPGIIDVLQVVAGFVVFGLDTILCQRYREWNLASLSLEGSLPTFLGNVSKKPECCLCSFQIQ